MLVTNCHITTKRLELVPLHARHSDSFMAIAAQWSVARMTADIPHPLTRRAAQLWFQLEPNDIRFAIELSGQMIGTAGYYSTAPDGGELGFMICPSHWSNGYASEAARAVIAHGFENGALSQFTSSHFADNPASARVLQKLGFQAVARFDVRSEARRQTIAALGYRLERPDTS